jgi:hypothetical protein
MWSEDQARLLFTSPRVFRDRSGLWDTPPRHGCEGTREPQVGQRARKRCVKKGTRLGRDEAGFAT